MSSDLAAELLAAELLEGLAEVMGKKQPKPKAAPKPEADNLTPARALFGAGFKLCALKPMTKQPVGEGWNKPENCVTSFDDSITGYGLPLAINNRCSIDPDHVDMSRVVFASWGFDYEQIMSAGVRTRSTRKGSGGRSQFADPGKLAWLKVRTKIEGKNITVLELRAGAANLQDVIPGLTYLDSQGNTCTQAYANGKTFLDSVPLPEEFSAFWARCSSDGPFWMLQEIKAQQALMAAGYGGRVMHDLSGQGLPFPEVAKGLRVWFNETHAVEDILFKHNYSEHGKGRWSSPDATGEPGIRLIPKHESLWQSSHGSDPLNGTFDAAVASIVLDYGGDPDAWEIAMREERVADTFSEEIRDAKKKAEPEPEKEPEAKDGRSLILRLLDPYIVTEGEAKAMCDTDWWIPNLIPKSHIVALPAPSGAGKTAVAIACCNLLAQDFAEVFFVSLDSSPADIKYQQGQATQYGYHVIQPDAKQGMSLNDFKHSLVQLADEADDLSNTVIFCDTLKKIVAMLDKTAATAFYKLLRRLVAKGCTVVLLSHTNKYAGEDGNTVFEGTGDHRADVDDMVYLDYFRNEEGGYNDITTRPDKQRANFSPISMRVWFRGERKVEFLDDVLVIKNEIDTEVEEKALDCLANGRKTMTNLVRDVAAVCEHSKETVRKALVRLSNDDGPMERFPNRGRGGGYTVGVRDA